MAPGTYGKTWWREGYACGCMIQSIEDIVEPRLRAAGYLGSSQTVDAFQQAYSSSVGASAGTHGGGGAIDHRKGSDGETKIWRECGWADWQRGSPEDTAFDDHNHGIVQGCTHLSGEASSQVTQYKQGCNGLADWGADQSPDVPPITWTAAYDKYIGTTNPGGIFGMTELAKMSRSKDIKVPKDDDWHLMHIDDEDNLSLVTGSAQFIAYSAFDIAGLPPGAAFQCRFARVYDYPDSKETTVEAWYPIQEIIGTSGNSYGEVVYPSYVGDNAPSNGKEKIRLYAKSPAAAVTVASITSRVFHD